MQKDQNKPWQDKGWEKMKQLLDDDMPVAAITQKQGLNVLFRKWFLVAVGIILLLSTGIIYLLDQQSTMPYEKQSTPAQPTAKLQPTETEKVISEITPTTSQAETIGTVINDLDVKKAVEMAVVQPQRTVANTVISNQERKAQTTAPQLTMTSNTVENGLEITSQTSNTASETAPIHSLTSIVGEVERTSADVLSLPIPPLRAFDQKTSEQIALSSTIGLPSTSAKHSALRWNCGVSIGTMANTLQKLDGFTAGFTTELGLRKTPLAISGGVGYKRLNQLTINDFKQETGPNTQVLDNEPDIENSGLNVLKGSYNSEPTAFLIPKNLDYLNASIGLHYQINRYFDIHTGLEAARVLRRFDKFDIQDDSSLTPAAQIFQLEPSKMEYGAMAGIQMHPFRRVAVSLDYRLGLSNVWQSAQVSKKLNYLHLSLRYNLKA